jgi:transposase-like protein
MPWKTDPAVFEKFKKHIAKQNASRLSIAEYCKDHGIAPHRYYYWKRKLTASDVETDREASSEFVPVRIVDNRRSSDAIVIRLPNGAEISLPLSALEKLDAIIKSAGCISC